MQRGVLVVESAPVSPERLDDYNAWYDEVHIPEILAHDGFVSARRFEPVDDGPHVAIYEMEADDLAEAFAAYRAASARGEMTRTDALRTDPPPRVRLLRLR